MNHLSRRFILALLLAIVTNFSQVVHAQDPDPLFVTTPDATPGQYVVAFQDQQGGQPDPTAIATGICNNYGAQMQVTYTASGSFMATMNEAQARQMSHDVLVDCVFGDVPMYGDTVQNTSLDARLWGLDRIDQHYLPLSGTYSYVNTGVFVDASYWTQASGRSILIWEVGCFWIVAPSLEPHRMMMIPQVPTAHPLPASAAAFKRELLKSSTSIQ